MINARDIVFSYDYSDRKRSLNGVSIDVHEGELVAVLGHNGCGKSTLIKHFNALLDLQKGELTVAGLDAKCEANIIKLRRTVGMVFQNPDNQFVSSIVEEDVAFGLENYGISYNEIPEKVSAALKTVGMEGFEKRSPSMLSGGQKQRVALAGVLAVDPDILVFDEVTSMLDPDGRCEVLSTIKQLHEKRHKTIVMITHYIDEAVFADRVYFMHDGKMLASGTPREMLTDLELLGKTGLTPPLPVRMYHDLKDNGIELPFCPLTNDELTEAICRLK
ncbi:MAG: energy-coupling factor transporter ATPase [Oscillospiraceae bacterium]|nr:energy-coupling factor transporter ATPase [Oscillospiraceae bacterium]